MPDQHRAPAEDGARCWFAVLPDGEPAHPVARRLAAAGDVVSHRSGRPWLVGSLGGDSSSAVRHVRTRHLDIVVIGLCALDAPTLRARAAHARRPADVAPVFSGVAGSFHVIATDGGTTWVRGAAFDTRRVFYAEVDGAAFATDSEPIAARLTDARLDDRYAALRLASASPSVLGDLTPWLGVRAVPAGWALHLTNGGARVERWWEPPSADLSLVDGADALRDALRGAVRLRANASGGVVAADLSGGLDSTSLCFLAEEAGARLTTATLRWAAAGNEDAAWADLAAGHLRDPVRHVYRETDLPALFTGLARRSGRSPREPTALVRDRGQLEVISRDLAASGASLRLVGHGGDQVVQPPLAHLQALVREHPVRGLRELAGFRARGRWSVRDTVRMIADRRGYGGWLQAAARALAAGAEPDAGPPGWESLPVLPPWASPTAVEAVRAALLARSARPPLAPSRAAHSRVLAAVEAGRLSRQLADGASASGLPIAAPFCDDAVVEACLAVRTEHLRPVNSYKPLLQSAMRGIVPPRLLERTTKDHCGVEWYRGLRAQATDLAELSGDSRLVARGLVDRERYRRALRSPALLRVSALVLESTLALEAWFREQAANPVAEKG